MKKVFTKWSGRLFVVMCSPLVLLMMTWVAFFDGFVPRMKKDIELELEHIRDNIWNYEGEDE